MFTRHEHSVGDPAPDALWAHERVVERLMADRTVLPMRFGSTVTDDDAVRRLLVDRQTAFLAMLARIRGRVELGVRVVHLAPEPMAAAVAVATAPALSGRDYLLGKMQNGRRAAGIGDPLAHLAVESRLQAPRSADEVLRASYLVERSGVARFRAAVERLQGAHPEAGNPLHRSMARVLVRRRW